MVRVVQTEGLTECHPHVCKSPPSVKLATDCHFSQVNIQPYSVYILFCKRYNTGEYKYETVQHNFLTLAGIVNEWMDKSKCSNTLQWLIVVY